MIKLDDSCIDILASLLLTTSKGKKLRSSYKSKKISKASYLNKLYLMVDDFISSHTVDEIAETLSKQSTYKFNPKKILSKITDNNRAAFIAEPIIYQKGEEFGLSLSLDNESKFIKYLCFDVENLRQFLMLLHETSLYSCGLNMGHSESSPCVLVFGYEHDAKELKAKLERSCK